LGFVEPSEVATIHTVMTYKFPKSQRLCSRKVIERLYKKGSKNTEAVFFYPFRVVYDPSFSETEKTKILFVVPKRSFKKAVDRNTIKRRCKEAFRLHQHTLLAGLPNGISAAYVGKEIHEYAYLEQKMIGLLKKLNEQYTNTKAVSE
jgi:ribonuclease P protein component